MDIQYEPPHLSMPSAGCYATRFNGNIGKLSNWYNDHCDNDLTDI